MQQLRFPFLTDHLAITLSRGCKEQQLRHIESLAGNRLSELFFALNSRVATSEITRLNSSDIGYPVQVSTDLWEFTRANMNISELPGWVLDPENRVITRVKDHALDSTPLFMEFVIDDLTEALHKFGVTEMLITSHTAARASGNELWNARLPLLPEGQVEIEICGGGVAGYVLDDRNDAGLSEPKFGRSEQQKPAVAVAVSARTAVEAKLLTKCAGTILYPYQRREFAGEHKCGLTYVFPGGVTELYRA